MTEPTLPAEPPTFFARFLFAWQCLFRIWFDAEFAARLERAAKADASVLELTGATRSDEPSTSHAPEAAAERSAARAEAHETAARAHAEAAELRANREREQAQAGALQLLGLLQREGRFVDFIQQDIAKFPDAEIGAAARVVHAGCRKALAGHAVIEPARPEAEGSRLTLDADFDRTRLKLTGNVGGKPPYLGVLRHRGWIVRDLSLPILVEGYDARVVAAAEVEL